MYFQNPFSQEFQGFLVLSDRQYNVTFKCPGNAGRGEDILTSWGTPPYNMSGNDGDGVATTNLTINYAYDPSFKFYSSLTINVATGASSSSAVTPNEIVTNLNANATFASLFTASVQNTVQGGTVAGPPFSIVIKYKRPSSAFRAFISNNGAETLLKFNARAGIAELPQYFLRHSYGNRLIYTDSQGMLIPLNHVITGISVANPTTVTSTAHGLANGQAGVVFTNSNSSPTINGTRTVTLVNANSFTVPVNVTTAGDRGFFSTAVEASLIDNALNPSGKSLGYSSASVKTDWELLRGRSGLFTFQKITVDGSDRITQIIEYGAGSQAGDLARKIKYSYTSSNTKPDLIAEIPYVLASGDLITPP